MTSLEGTVDRIRKRLILLELAHAASRLLLWLALAAAVIVFTDKILHLGTALLVGAGALAAGVLVAWLVVTRRRISMLYAAERIDETFGLQERVSTALAMGSSHEPMVPALENDAERQAGKIDPSRFRFRPSRQLALLPLPLACIVGLMFLQPIDLLGRGKREEQKKVEQAEVKKQVEHLKMKAQELMQRADRAKSPEAQKLALQMQKLAADLARQPEPKKEAMLKMAKLSEEAKRVQEQAARAEKFDKLDLGKTGQLDSKLRELNKAQQAMQQLADAMQKGDLAKASDALKELANKLENGTISDAEAKKLGEALNELAKNMPAGDQLTQQMQQLAQQLAKNGTKDAQGLKQALQQMKLTQEQMKELQKLMQQMQAADFAQDVLDYEKMCMSCKKAGGVCPVCGNPPCGGCGTYDCVCCIVSVGPDGGPCCKTGPGAGMCAGGGAGMAWQRGPIGGQGTGQRPLSPPGPVNYKDTKTPNKMTPGKVLATQFLRGMPPDDAEAKAEYRNVLQAAQKDAEDAIHREDIPPEYRDKIKGYFEDLEKK